MKALLTLTALLAVAAPVSAKLSQQDIKDQQAGEAQLAKLTKGLVPGQPTSCAPTERWTGSTNIDRVGILYELGSTRYLSRMPDCHFGMSDVPVITSYGQTCRGDIVRVIDNTSHFPTGSCVLGDFVPYTRPKTK